MCKETMSRRSSDNEYLHKDFHGALSTGIEYIHDVFGADAVRDYLRQFTRTYYADLTEEIEIRGLAALRDYFEEIYAAEGGQINIDFSDDEMLVEVEAYPPIVHMREHGYAVACLFHETIGTVNEALCEATPFASEVVQYDEKTGHVVQRFYRRLAG